MAFRLPKRRPVEDRTTTTGIVCDSVFEKDVVQDLIDRGHEFEFHPETREYASKIRGAFCRACDARGEDGDVWQGRKYTMDLELPNGRWVEIKGKFPAHKRRLLSEFVKQHGPISFVFMANNRLTKGKPTRYSDWAEKLGCPDVIGKRIP